MNEEKSPLDIINDLHAMMLNMSQTMAIMDRNIKILNDKANGALFPNPADIIAKLTPIQNTVLLDLEQTSTVGIIQNSNQPMETQSAPTPASPTESHVQKQNIKVESKILSADKKPIHGVKVTVLNSTNNVVKSTATNRAGVWMCYLPPGKYTVKYEHMGKILQQKNIEVNEGQKEILL